MSVASSPRTDIMSAPQGSRSSGGRGRTARGRGTTASRSSRNQFRAKSISRLAGPADTISSANTEATPKAKLATRQPGHRIDLPKPSPSATFQPQTRMSGQALRTSISPPLEEITQASGMGATALPLQKQMVDLYQKVCEAPLQLLTRWSI